MMQCENLKVVQAQELYSKLESYLGIFKDFLYKDTEYCMLQVAKRCIYERLKPLSHQSGVLTAFP